MKTIYKLITAMCVLLCLLSVSNVNAQVCGPAGFLYPSINITPTGSYTPVDGCSFGGDYIQFNVVAGHNYDFSTCPGDGSNVTYDSQLELYDNSLNWIAYSDDYCGLQSHITWTATYTGVAHLNLHQYPCGDNSICSTVMMRDNSLGGGYNPCNGIVASNACGVNNTTVIQSGNGLYAFSPYGPPSAEVIYTYTPAVTGNYTFTVTTNSFGYYTDFFFKPVSGGCNGTGWTFVQDVYNVGTSFVTAAMTAGVPYYIMVDEEGYTSGGTITWRLDCPVIPGDLCTNAIAISCGSTVTGNTTGAGTDANSCGGAGSPGLWYTITPATTSTITLSLCGSSYDTRISAYSGSCASLTSVGCNDDFCGLQSQISFLGNAGQTYYILVNAFTTSSGAFTLSATCAPVGGPANDVCSGAIPMSCGSTVTGNTSGATSESTACNSWSSPGVWYSITPTFNCNITMSLCGSSYDTWLSAYSGSCSSLSCITQIDDFCGLQSQITFPGIAFNTYYILVNGFSTASGAFTLSSSCVVAAPAPPNDDCSAAVPVLLTPGSPLSFSGTTVGATAGTDGSFSAFPTVWHAFTLTSCADVVISYCTTSPAFQDVWINLATACPAFSFTPAGNYAACGNGNYTITYNTLSPGNYWIPVLGEEFGYVVPGPYTVTATATACAPAPPNDDCSSAVPVLLTSASPIIFSGNTVGATSSSDGAFSAYPTVWHAFTLNNCASVTLSYCATSPAFQDIWIDLATSCPANSFVASFNYSGCGNGNYTITYPNLAAGTYWVPVLGNEPGYVTPGPYTITVSAVDCPPPPVNDECAGALPIQCGSTVSGDNTAAADDAAIAATCGSAFSGQYHGVWYVFSIIFPSDVTLTTCNTGMPAWDTYIRVFSGSCNSLSCVNYNDDAPGCGSYVFHSTLNLPNLPAGTYYVMLGGYGSTSFGSYNLSLACSSLVPPSIVSNSPVCEGTTLTVESPAAGIAYQWSFNGSPISGATNHDYEIISADLADAGNYEVLITTVSSSYTTSGIVVVNPTPSLSASASPAFCEGTQDLNLNSTAPTATNWSWTGPGGYTSGDEDPVRNFTTASMSGNYTVVVTDANDCQNTQTISVTIYALPPVALVPQGSTHLCTGQFLGLLGDGAGLTGTYLWSTAETGDNITISTGGTYSVTGTDLHGCINTDQIVITESAPPPAPIIVALGDVNLCSSDGGVLWTSVTLHTTNYTSGLAWNTAVDFGQDLLAYYPSDFNVTYTDALFCSSTSNTISTIANLASTDPLDAQVSSDAIGNITCASPITLTLAEADGTDPLAPAYLGSGAQWVWYDDAGCGVNQVGTGASVVITPPAIPGPHNYYVRAEGLCNTTACATITVIVKDYSIDPTSASASVSSLCSGDQTMLSVNGGFLGTGAQWKWYSGSCGGTLVGIGASVTVNTASTTTYFVRAEGDCNNSGCASTTVTVNTLSTDPTTATSNAPVNGICIGGSVILSVSGGSLGTGSDWVWYEDGCGNGASIGTGASVTITPAFDGLHSYYVRAEGPCNTTNCAAVSVLVGTYSVEAAGITSSVVGSSICTGNNITLTLDGGFLGTVAEWKWYSGTCGGTLVATGVTTITVSPTATTTYYVRAEGSCNNTLCASQVVSVSTVPPTNPPPTIISAPNGICSGNGSTIIAQSVPGATFYSWSGPNGTTFDGNNPSPYVTTSNTVQVTFGNLPNGVSGYDICVFAGNGCGNTVTKCRYIRGRVQTAQTITGNASSCPNTNSVYSIVSLPGADSYTWTVTGAATINGGGTTLTTSATSVTVNFLPGWTNGTLSVYGSMSCGYSAPAKTITIISTPVVPGVMSGPTLVCPSGTYNYSIAPVAGALSYNWSTNVPGASVGAGTTSVSITFPAVIPAGSTVSVTATGPCGTSAPRVKNIATGLASTPGTISGPAMGQCGQTGVGYSILPVAGATSYLWTANNGANISGLNNITSVSVNFPAVFTTSTVSVQAINGCGISAPQTKIVTGAPGSPGAISGTGAVCLNSVETYSVIGSTGATQYVWTSPGASTIFGQGLSSIDVLFLDNTSGNITVYASNACGNSPTSSLAVSVVCRLAQISQGSLIDATLYPNPTIGTTTLKFETITAGDYKVSVVDMTGQVMETKRVTAVAGLNLHELDLSTYAKGLYMVRLEREGEAMQMLRVTVE